MDNTRQDSQASDIDSVTSHGHKDPMKRTTSKAELLGSMNAPRVAGGLNSSNNFNVKNSLMESRILDSVIDSVPEIDDEDIVDAPFSSTREVITVIWELFYQGILGAIVF